MQVQVQSSIVTWKAYNKSTINGCFTASNMFLSAFVCAVSLEFLTIVAFFSTFMAKILPLSSPVNLRTWNTLP